LPTLRNISFYQYKNYSKQAYLFEKRIICIHGKNGSGKTNLLDAVYYLGYTKSYFAKKDANVVQHLMQGMYIKGDFTDHYNNTNSIKIIIRENGKKELWQNEQDIKQVPNYIGQFPSIMISPDDTELINEGSEIRRKYLDAILCQINADYFKQLMHYNKILLQRNALLKNWNDIGGNQFPLLDFYNLQLAENGQFIFDCRKELCKNIFPIIEKLYTEITQNADEILLNYKSKLHQTALQDLLQKTIDTDLMFKRTTCGIHKDEIDIFSDSKNVFKEFASQGQKKTLLFAMKIAQYQYLKTALGITPILLLDDVFEKLDAQRTQHLLNLIIKENCQAFITDTHLERLQKAFENNLDEVEFLEIG
jgi:DNA replication and repair protein RecF